MKSGPASMTAEEIARIRQVGVNIRALRRRRGISQTDLASKAGMRPGPVNAIENGRSLPSTGVLLRLARVLEVPIETLFQDQSEGWYLRDPPAPYGRLLPRKRPLYSSFAKTPPPTAPNGSPVAPLIRLDVKGAPYPPAVMTMLDEVANAFLTLEDLCGVPKHPAIPLRLSTPMSEPGVECLVNKVRVLLGIGQGVIFDYVELLENAGLRVLFLPLPDGIGSAACYDEESRNAFLFVTDSVNVNTERKLFLLARELGRIYCHTAKLSRIAGRDRELDADHVASKFAAFFLMPCEAVLETVRQIGAEPNNWTLELLLRVKHRFGVSAESFLYRLGELDLIARPKMAELKKRILAHYQKTGHAEPGACRRILTPNGRLGDLLESARSAHVYPAPDTLVERNAVLVTLERHGIQMP